MAPIVTVLHLIETGGPGGAETVYRDLVTGLPTERYRSIPVIPIVDWLHGALLAAGHRPIVLGAAMDHRLRLLIRLRRLVREHRVDLVHAHLLGSGVYASLALLGTRVPVITTFHGLPDLGERNRILPLKLRIAARPPNQLTFVSTALRTVVGPIPSLSNDRSHVVHNGVEPKVPTLTGTERQELGVSADDFLLVAVGNLRPPKDYPTLLRAIALARRHGCPVRAAIIGEGTGPLRRELEALTSELALGDAVSFLGFRPDASRFLAVADVFALSSSTEGFSLSTVEALQLERPVVATRSGGPEEIVLDGVTGFLVPTSDPVALAEAIRRVHADPAAALKMGKAGGEDVRDRFSLGRMVEAYERIYLDALGAGPWAN